MNILIALLPALFWGILPLVVSRTGGTPSQQIVGTTGGTLLVSIVVAFFMPPQLSAAVFGYAFVSGACWAFGQMNQYRSFGQIGVSNAMPISTGMQLVSTSLVGVLAFGEWPSAQEKLVGFAAIALIVLGIYLTTRQEGAGHKGVDMKAGVITLLVSTVGYVGYSYFPRVANVNGQDAFLPQAVGMVVSALVMSLLVRDSRPFSRKTVQNLLGGFIFAAAALSYLVSTYRNGIATGFTLSQMNVVLATLGSIYILGEKKTPKEMRHVLAGLVLVVIGGVMIGLNA